MPVQQKVETPDRKLSPENLSYLCKAVYEDSGIVLDDSKRYLVETRLISMARTEGDGTIDSLCALLRASGGVVLRKKIVEAMTTNETLFFRDLKPFEALRRHLLPELIEKKAPGDSIRVWCAACSSGQEPYSLAMLWDQLNQKNCNLSITGTDLSDDILQRAREGCYAQAEVNRGLPAPLLVKYFQREGMYWTIKPNIRGMVQWKKFNLKDSMFGMGPFDVVFCRNVLIYFDLETKQGILRNLRKTLRPGGLLILGASETTLGVDENFKRSIIGDAVMYRNPENG
ncbi:MAG: protein-glutamate O-methyltransferase CheR [Acidobacteria bacterium]|nr:protein-glutamate O-methyltransferase CheR [Acidobacteriota bacterium]